MTRGAFSRVVGRSGRGRVRARNEKTLLRTFVLTVRMFAGTLRISSQCERSAVCRAQADEGFPPSPLPRSQDPLHYGKAVLCRWEGVAVPELSRFYGIVVRMYFDDDGKHSLPHLHAFYGNMDASYSLQGKRLGGKIPPKQEKLLLAWMALHEHKS